MSAAHSSWSERIAAGQKPPFWAGWTRRKDARVALIVLGFFAVVAVTWKIASYGGSDAKKQADAQPRRVRPAGILVETGELEASLVTPVFSRPSGEIVWMIDEGALVEMGDVIMRIDEAAAAAALEQEEISLIPRQTELERAEHDLEIARANGELRVSQMEIRSARAQWALDDLEKQPTEEARLNARLDFEVAELRHQRMRRDYERTIEFFEKDLATEAEVRVARLNALNAQADAALAETVLETVLRGPDPAAVATQRIRVERAMLDVEEARFNRDSDITIREQNVAIARARLDNQMRNVERRRRDLEQCEVRAPVAGRIAFVEVWKGTSQNSRLQVGETVRRNQMVCRVADTGKMRVRMHVNEVDALKLREGAPAKVRLTAFPGEVLSGRVRRIGLKATDKNENLGRLALLKAGRAGVNVVSVLVDLDDTPSGFRGGHTAEVEVELAPRAAAASEVADG